MEWNKSFKKRVGIYIIIIIKDSQQSSNAHSDSPLHPFLPISPILSPPIPSCFEALSHKSASESQSKAGARNLRLRRSHIHRRGTDNGRPATVNSVHSAGRAARQTNVGDAQWVGCNGNKLDMHVVPADLFFPNIRSNTKTAS